MKVFPSSSNLFRGNVPKNVLYIFDKLTERGYGVYLVGGAVRALVIREVTGG